jgi:uncharacterized delta-60 repeat protein
MSKRRGVYGGKGLLALAATLGLLGTAGCGDDDGASDDDGGEAGTSAGTSGKNAGGSSGKGGTSTAGKDGTGDEPVAGEGGTTPVAGRGGTGGSDVSPMAGAAGSEPDGEAGAGGDGAVLPTYHPSKLNGPDGLRVPGVNDLRGLVFSSSGKIYASGHVGANIAYPGGVDRQIAVVRFTADGALDTSFDGDGIKTFNLRTRVGVDENIINDGDEYSMGIVELPNGDLIVQCNVRDASGKGRDVELLKLNSKGEPVNFSALASAGLLAGSVRKIDFGWTDADNASFPTANAQPLDESWGLALDPAGDKVVVTAVGPAKKLATGDAGPQRTDNDRYIVRLLTSNGSVDPTFNGGQAYVMDSGLSDNTRRVKVEADGSIISAGYGSVSANGGANVFALHLLPDGTPDPQFAAGLPATPGVFVTNPLFVDQGNAECYSIAKQSTGRYVTTGYGRATGENVLSTFVPPYATTDAVDLISIGFKPSLSGSVLDSTFGNAATLVIQSEGLNLGGTEDRGRDVLALPDDRLVYAGRYGTSPAIYIATADGELDTTEGGLGAGAGGGDITPGVYTYAPLATAGAHFFAVAKSVDGKRVAATTNNSTDGALLAVVSIED